MQGKYIDRLNIIDIYNIIHKILTLKKKNQNYLGSIDSLPNDELPSVACYFISNNKTYS